MTAFAPETAEAPPELIFGHAEFIEALEAPMVTYDPAEVTGEVLDLLNAANLRALDPVTARALGQPLQERIRQLSAWVRGRAASTFRVVVIGEFKRGKSTLVNALLGQGVAATGVLPETLLISRYRWGEAFSAHLRFSDGGRRALDQQDLTRTRLTAILGDNPQAVEGVEISLPSAFMRDILLVDTPGLSDLGEAGRHLIFEEIANSDLVIAVVSAGLQLSLSERAVLKALVKPHEFSKILFVVNGVDSIEDERDLPRLETALLREAGDLFPGARLHMVSALDEIALRTGGVRPDPDRAEALASLFDRFRDDIIEMTQEQKALIRLDRLLVSAQAAFGEMTGRIQMVRSRLDHYLLNLDDDTVAADQAKIDAGSDSQARQEALRAEIESLGRTAAGWMRDFGDRLIAELSAQATSVSAIDVERELQFFVCEAAQSALTLSLEAHQEALQTLMSDLGLSLDDHPGTELTVSARDAAQVAYSGPNLASSAVIRRAIEQVTGAGLVFDLSMAVARMGAGDRGSAEDIRSRLDRHQLAAALGSMATAVYADLGDKLSERLQSLDKAAADALEEASAQARILCASEGDATRQMHQALEEFTSWIEETQDRVRTLRTRAS